MNFSTYKIAFYFLNLFLLFSCVSFGIKNHSQGYYKVVVKKGDTLASLAQKFDTTWQQIVRDNGLRDARDLYVGQVVYIKPGPAGFIASRDKEEIEKLLENKHIQSQNSVKKGGGFLSRLFGLYNSNDDDIPTSSIYSLEWPVHGEISSDYGYRWFRKHHGIDIKVPIGTPVKSAQKGKVIFTGYAQGYGKTIIIDHGSFKTIYAHLSHISVEKGDEVFKAQYIGDSGNTGTTTGPHLHFEVQTSSGISKNPLLFLSRK